MAAAGGAAGPAGRAEALSPDAIRDEQLTLLDPRFDARPFFSRHSAPPKILLRCCDDRWSLLGSVLGLINTAGGVAVTYTYDPYGNTTSTGGHNTALAASNPFRYARGYLDTATGLYNYGARYYQPTLGRWTQQDTLNIIGDPANGNRYTYAGEDPSNNIDPTGTLPSLGDVLGTVGAIVAGGLAITAIAAACGTGAGCLVVGAIAGASYGAAGGALGAAAGGGNASNGFLLGALTGIGAYL